MVKKLSNPVRTAADPQIPTIGFVILGRLAQEDQTGYELASFMGPPRNYIWEANHSQIYPLLAKLTELNYVGFTEVVQTGKPDKKVYRITKQGIETLQAWVLDSPTQMTRRLEFNAKVNSLWLLPRKKAIEVVEAQIAMTLAEIEMIEGHQREAQQRAGVMFPPPPGHSYSGVYANIQYAIGSRKFMIDWYRWVQSEFLPAPARKAKKLNLPVP
jgi:PadR family transcriptional regulator AphA